MCSWGQTVGGALLGGQGERCSSCLGLSSGSPGAWPGGGGMEEEAGERWPPWLPSQDIRLWVMEATGRFKVERICVLEKFFWQVHKSWHKN